ncbi:hypothetical protein LSH36_74g05058 [Paralvinella palmiformis]|uniref:Uncharacterized protein n=1 Tax=Paralvinella palmiformis TaxID=53620 RepID=A0AAD9NBC3_9ANNE|nr:hypothetical protein LSH36_74g05058 [Paralvinella palmiformis]
MGNLNLQSKWSLNVEDAILNVPPTSLMPNHEKKGCSKYQRVACGRMGCKSLQEHLFRIHLTLEEKQPWDIFWGRPAWKTCSS